MNQEVQWQEAFEVSSPNEHVVLDATFGFFFSGSRRQTRLLGGRGGGGDCLNQLTAEEEIYLMRDWMVDMAPWFAHQGQHEL